MRWYSFEEGQVNSSSTLWDVENPKINNYEHFSVFLFRLLSIYSNIWFLCFFPNDIMTHNFVTCSFPHLQTCFYTKHNQVPFLNVLVTNISHAGERGGQDFTGHPFTLFDQVNHHHLQKWKENPHTNRTNFFHLICFPALLSWSSRTPSSPALHAQSGVGRLGEGVSGRPAYGPVRLRNCPCRVLLGAWASVTLRHTWGGTLLRWNSWTVPLVMSACFPSHSGSSESPQTPSRLTSLKWTYLLSISSAQRRQKH